MTGGAYPKEAADWDRHRNLITRLYLDEDRPLKEVQQIMQSQFRFKAT